MSTPDNPSNPDALRKEALEEMRKAALLMRKLGKVAASQTAVSIEAHRLREEEKALTAQQLREKREQERQAVAEALRSFTGALPLADVKDWEHNADDAYKRHLHRPVELQSNDLETIRLFEASVWWHRTTTSQKEIEGGYEVVRFRNHVTPYYQIGERFIAERKRGKDAEIEMLLIPAMRVDSPELLVVRTSLKKKDHIEESTLAGLGKPLLNQGAYRTNDPDLYSLRTRYWEDSFYDYAQPTNGNNQVNRNREFVDDKRSNYKHNYFGLPAIAMRTVTEADMTKRLLQDYNVEFYATRLAVLFGAEEEYQRSLGVIDDPQVDAL